MQLLLNQASPYARLARVVVLEKKLGDQVELRWTDPWASPPELLAANPAAKVPALVVDGGQSIVDSACIAMHLDQTGQGPTLFPPGVPTLMKYGLGRSLIDVAFGVTIERRYAPSKEPSVLVERWLAAVARTIAALEEKALALSHERPDIGDLSIAVGLAYVEFRLKEVSWRAGAPRLAAWCDAIAARPSLRTTAPE
jgi:glutathione S-transferase